MKNFTFVMCLLFSAIASCGAAPKGYNNADLSVHAIDERLNVVAEPFSLCLEAENSDGTGPVTDDPNASGGKTRGAQNAWDHYVDYQVNGVAAGRYQLTIRYYAAHDATVRIAVNGTVAAPVVNLPATNSWNIVWAEHTVDLDLNAGNNRIRIQGLQGYSVRQDKICVTGSGTGEPVTCNFDVFPRVSKPQVLPGETITLNANCSGSDCSGVLFRWTGQGIDTTGATITITAPMTPGGYSYPLTASKDGCVTKTSNAYFVVDDTPTCDFILGTIVPNYTPSCGTRASMHVDCNGPDCYALNYKWSGNGINETGTSIVVPVPSTNGTFYYTLTASKNGCPDRITTTELRVSDCTNTPTDPYSACIEAENSNGNGPVTEDPNASNGKTRGAQDNWNHYVEYEVNGVKVTGPHELTLRYYAAGDGAVDIVVNGGQKVPVVGLPATHSWNIAWAERTVTVNLVEGNNKVRIIGLPGYSPVRQDRICVTGSGGTGNPPTCDFNVTASAVSVSLSCTEPVAIYALCSGFDCESVSYQWSGHGIDLPGRIVYLDAPGKNGTFTYTVTATKNACPPKTATVEFTVSGCEPTGGPFSACVEAEHSASNGPGSDDPNASNGQTRGAQNNYDYYVDYAINDVPASGFYPVTLRYYAAQNAQVSVTINGVLSIPSLPLAATNSWNIVWRDEVFYITLFKGNNTVRIQGLPGAACRQDRFCVSPAVSTVRMAAPGSTEIQTDVPLLQAYPNPAPGEFKAAFYLQPGKVATLQITDTQGKVWHQRQVNGKGTHEERINLGSAPSGIYLLQVKKPDSVETKKILYTR